MSCQNIVTFLHCPFLPFPPFYTFLHPLQWHRLHKPTDKHTTPPQQQHHTRGSNYKQENRLINYFFLLFTPPLPPSPRRDLPPFTSLFSPFSSLPSPPHGCWREVKGSSTCPHLGVECRSIYSPPERVYIYRCRPRRPFTCRATFEPGGPGRAWPPGALLSPFILF